MTRARLPVAAQFVLAWLPVWALYSILIGPANPIHPGASMTGSAVVAMRSIGIAALLGLAVKRFAERLPWPYPFRVSFALLHLAGAATYATSWFILAAAVEQVIRPGALHVYVLMLAPNMVLGVWLYAMIAGTLYAVQATERAARAEAAAVRGQLAALRSQLNPHFLFNALHTVVQLIPVRPETAGRAAEQVAGLLRTALEDERDLVPLADELAFVERYLEVERLRFGDRLDFKAHVSDEARRVVVPGFSLLTLVENAVRHGAAPRVEKTTIELAARLDGNRLSVTVTDDGAGASGDVMTRGTGTGLKRLRDRVRVIYGDAANLSVDTAPGRGFVARLTIPAADVE